MLIARRWCPGKGIFTSRERAESRSRKTGKGKLLTSPWHSNNIRGQWKRAFTSATLIGGGSIGGIIASTVFRAQDAPGYRPGLLAAVLANVLIVLIVAGLDFSYYIANKRAQRSAIRLEGLEGFRYTL